MHPPIDVRPLFGPLDDLLLDLLRSLKPSDWDLPTAARRWRVRDVVAHLLDGNLRTLSAQRDGYLGEAPPPIDSYATLVAWLDSLNATWVQAARRLSPGVLVALHEATGRAVTDYYCSLDPAAEAVFAVSWAGETRSLNSLHLAREYTEKWHHQQQIREATGQAGLMSRTYFYPFIDTMFRAWPHTFRSVAAPEGTLVHAAVTGPAGGDWYLRKGPAAWHLSSQGGEAPAARVRLAPDIAWKLFCYNIRPAEAPAELHGDPQLGRWVLDMVAVMA
ncbi:MAG: hypothetical protein OHK0039_31900 [Bacteroidia bacterium]